MNGLVILAKVRGGETLSTPFSAYCRHRVDSVRAYHLKRWRRLPSWRQMNIYGIPFSSSCQREIRFMAASSIWRREKETRNIAELRGRQRAICIWYFQPGRWLSGAPATKKSRSSEQGPTLPFVQHSIPRSPSTARAFTNRRKDEGRWKDKRQRGRERRMTGRWDLQRRLYWGFQVVGCPPLMETPAEKVFCDKLCNYGGGTSVAADLWIVRGVASTRPWHLSSA